MDPFITSGGGRNLMCTQLERVDPHLKHVLSVTNSDFTDSMRVFPMSTDLYELVHWVSYLCHATNQLNLCYFYHPEADTAPR
jgi:hypothetical protein